MGDQWALHPRDRRTLLIRDGRELGRLTVGDGAGCITAGNDTVWISTRTGIDRVELRYVRRDRTK